MLNQIGDSNMLREYQKKKNGGHAGVGKTEGMGNDTPVFLMSPLFISALLWISIYANICVGERKVQVNKRVFTKKRIRLVVRKSVIQERF